MNNNNRDTKPLEGEYTVENNLTPDEAADRFANKWPHVAMKCARESFLSGYNWQKEQYTERVEGESQLLLLQKYEIIRNNTYDLGKSKNKVISWRKSILHNLNKNGVYLTSVPQSLRSVKPVTTPSTSTTMTISPKSG